MKVPSLLYVVEILAIYLIAITQGWKWKPEHKRWNWRHSETDYHCSRGQCIEAWKCPEHLIAEHLTGSCGKWSSESMVCCVFRNDGDSHHLDKTDIYSSESTSNEYFKQSDPTFWRQTTRTHKFTDDYLHNPNLDTWDSKQRPTPISSLADFIGNTQDKFSTRKPYKRVTNSYFDNTSKHQGFRTTRNKPPISKSGIVFPTESAWKSKTTTHSARTIKVSTTPYRSMNKTTTLRPWGYTTKKMSRTTKFPYSNKFTTVATHFQERGNGGWDKYTTSRPTRRQTVKPKSTTRSGVTPSPFPRITKKPIFPLSSRSTPSTPRTTKRSFVTSSVPKTTKKYRSTTELPNRNQPLCGIRNQKLRNRRQNKNRRKRTAELIYADNNAETGRLPYERIVGGEEAEPFSWPWVVALYKVTSSGGHRFLSAGSLINERFILTAAHVFTPEDLRTASFVVMLGTHDAQDAFAEYLVDSVLQHPQYEQRYYYHDIALLRLNKPVAFNNYVMPVCLPSSNTPLMKDRDLEGKNVTVMGWGDESFGGKSSRVLKEATFPIVSRVSCNASYIKVASNRFPKGITNNMLCAGDPNGGKDACQGDSGGPLTSVQNGKYTQVGIVSFGYKCGDKEFPGVYTKVAPYLNWIGENSRCNEDYSDYYSDYSAY